MNMRNSQFALTRHYGMTLLFVLLTCAWCAPLQAQTDTSSASSAAKQPTNRQKFIEEDYHIGPGDVLSIAVTDAPEFSGRFRVDQSGDLVMSSLPNPVKAQGETTMQLSKELTKALEDAKLYRDPTVNIFVEEYHSQTVAVVGAVSKPGLYPLQRRTTVMEVISEAGLLPTAGNQVTILPASGNAPDNQPTQAVPRTLELAKLMSGKDTTINAEVHDGEVVSVATAEVVYVVGAVTKPGGFVFQDRTAGVSALQAIALAQGMTSTASAHRGLVIRRNPDGSARENVPVDLAKIMSGKDKDFPLEANDILFVPVSGKKQTLVAMGTVAMAAVNGAVFYGVGYRVGGL